MISNEVPLEVKYFNLTAKGTSYYLTETSYDVCLEDLEEKVDPKISAKGRRKYYQFET